MWPFKKIEYQPCGFCGKNLNINTARRWMLDEPYCDQGKCLEDQREAIKIAKRDRKFRRSIIL